jgi:LmbE family N-acetylglucosaminyl deacetylase
MKKILVITPHTDDELFGMGGTLIKLKSEGHKIKIVLLSGSDRYLKHLDRVVTEEEQWNEFVNSCSILSTEPPEKFIANNTRIEDVSKHKIIKFIDSVIDNYCPTTIYTCEPSYHQEHVITYECALSSCRPTNNKKISEVILYESPTSTWSDTERKFIPNLYSDITKVLNDKIETFKNCYKIQHTKKERDKLSEEGIINHNRYRGFECGVEYAESFRIIRKIF